MIHEHLERWQVFVGRKQYTKLMRELLEREETGVTVVQPLVAWFNAHQPNADVRVTNLLEIISDIRCPIIIAEETKSKEQIHSINVKVGHSAVLLLVLVSI